MHDKTQMFPQAVIFSSLQTVSPMQHKQAQSINNDLHTDKQLCRMTTPFTAFILHLDIQINNDC